MNSDDVHEVTSDLVFDARPSLDHRSSHPQRAILRGVPESAYPQPPKTVGAPRSGRDRRHEFPGRSRRLAPTFTDEEYAAVTSAAARVGLTPTGFCGLAAIAAASPPAESTSGIPAIGDERVEALASLQAELVALRTAVVRVGTNLNQAVAALNSTGEAPGWLRNVVDLCTRSVAAVDGAASRVHRRLP